MKEKFPNKNTEDSLEKELEYCKQLLSIVKDNEDVCSYPKVQEKLNLLEESVKDDLEHLETSKDNDAKIGHKTADTSFFGYNVKYLLSPRVPTKLPSATISLPRRNTFSIAPVTFVPSLQV